jgi:SAM-dependent methyltransferase
VKSLDFQNTYRGLVRRLKTRNSLDVAMKLAVGGDFDAIGILELELLIEFGLNRDDYVIDVGCGSGRLAKPLCEYLTGPYLGIDIVPDLVEYARKLVGRPDWRFEVAKGLTIPESDGKADVVCFFSVFTHLLHEQSYAYLKEAKRVLKPSGKIVFSFLEFSVPDHWSVFEANLKAIANDVPLNMFMSRDAIEAWTSHLDLEIQFVERGDEPFLPLSAPILFEDGRVSKERTSFGHSICLLTKSGFRIPGSNYSVVLDRVLTPEPWCVDYISYDGQVFEVTGWALAPEGRHELLAFTLNDREFEETEFPLPRQDIMDLFWYKAGGDRAAFRCRSSVKREEAFRDGYVTLKCVNRETTLPVRAEFNLYYPADGGPELPDAERRKRESGSESAVLFVQEGFSAFKKLDLALNRTLNRSIGDFGNVLDWGCGCGRVTRYFSSLHTRLFGVDRDEENVNWCRRQFPFGEFRIASLRPPTTFDAESFDLIIGVSMFSRLREKDQQEWLSELSRIAKPGAVLLMCTQGESTVARSGWTERLWNNWQKTGFLAGGTKSDLGELGDEEYYVNTYMTEDYIRRNWSRFFEIVDFIPAYIGNHQDLAVMRKRG